MKIVQINKFFYPKGGSETYFFDLRQALSAQGHTVIDFSMRDDRNEQSPYADYFIDPIDFTKEKSLKKAAHFLYSTEAAKKLERLLIDTSPDIAHVHNIAHQLTPSILRVLKKHHIPVVQTLHDYQLICPNYQLFTQGSPCERCNAKKYWNAIRYKCVQDSRLASALSAAEMGLHRILLRSYENGIDRFIAPSQFLYDKLIEWGWKKEDLFYLPHFVNRKKDSTIEKKNHFLFIGRLTKEKGVRTLIEASHMTKMPIVIAGEGEEREWIEKHAPSHVRVLGFQQRESVYRLIQEARAVIVPSLWYENAPMVVYESLALGTPVIASDIGGLPELIEDGVNGFVFEAGNSAVLAEKMNVLASSSLQIKKNQYNVESHITSLFQLYEEILAR